jgi:LacI family transcriptional regulator
MATLADVARRAGVSPATTSRVINGSSKPVAADLRERVLKAVAELRYVPNAHAQLLARPRRSVVGVIVHDVSDPYFAEVTRGLQRVATEQGRLVIRFLPRIPRPSGRGGSGTPAEQGRES